MRSASAGGRKTQLSSRKLPGGRLEPLLRKNLLTVEDEPTAALIVRMRAARRRGYLTPSELEAVCYWKSPRAIRLIRSNLPARVRAATRSALAARNEIGRTKALLEIRGVAVPMASALLMLLDPKRYGVIDIRTWQLLHETGAVTKNARGTGLTLENWLQYLTILRRFARKFGVTARDIGRTLFYIHRERQEGRLYG